MKPDIAGKLTAALRKPITSEQQVVYILVETRKLTELSGVKQDFSTLTFCCDWAVHASLDGAFARKVIKHVDEYEDIFQQKGVMPEGYNFAQLFNITKHVDFRKQLIKFLNANGVECGQLTDDAQWARFIELYSRVIQDCPLKAKASAGGIKHVSEVSVTALPPDSGYRKAVGRLILQWRWKDKAGKALRSIDSYF
jgi:hypothetical protein